LRKVVPVLGLGEEMDLIEASNPTRTQYFLSEMPEDGNGVAGALFAGLERALELGQELAGLCSCAAVCLHCLTTRFCPHGSDTVARAGLFAGVRFQYDITPSLEQAD
jgi:hypothetical protein